ncbi:tetratricopeptide repeat protein [Rhodohalobacter halophilus]|uniref:tetratricopeptide repeat protein n=1 Tax=Rhodohalobacter halophilus TaxID=1812810 RepID=UPI00083F6318|nr:tetratricopeptide repeat protein [Rhodohalobacter halophilus]
MLFRIFTVTALLSLLSVISLSARQSDFQTANRLYQQQHYEQAIPLFADLHERNPRSNVYFERLVEALINNGELGRAEEVVRNQIGRNLITLQAKAKLGEILHLNSKPEEALEVWYDVLDENPQNIQATYIIASSMASRQEFEEAAKAYRAAREIHNNPTLFLNELANTYLLAGRFDEAVNEYFTLIMEAPQQMAIVQQRFFQMRDEQLYDIASFELEDLLLELSPSHEAYSALYQLLGWLLIETEQYERSYNFARHYEEETPYTVYSLFELGSRLLSARQFSTAERAYTYYLNSSNQGTKHRVYDELSHTYLRWAQFAEQNNLLSADSIRTLYHHSYDRAESLMQEYPEYNRSARVLSRLTDLALDYMKDPLKAKGWIDQLISVSGSDSPYSLYAEGRLAIFEQRFGESRRLLARADRATEESNLSEKVRYYSALSDFFSGDAEFAEIQLRSLERRNSSYFANDAVKLRMWIQNGLRADTTGAELNKLGNGLFALHTGNYEMALETLEEFISNPEHPFTDDLTVELSSALPEEYSNLKLRLIVQQIESTPNSPLIERLMWDRATIIDQAVRGKLTLNSPQTAEEKFFDSSAQFSFTREDSDDFYEELIVRFPNGFYASFAREKLQQSQIDYL